MHMPLKIRFAIHTGHIGEKMELNLEAPYKSRCYTADRVAPQAESYMASSVHHFLKTRWHTMMFSMLCKGLPGLLCLHDTVIAQNTCKCSVSIQVYTEQSAVHRSLHTIASISSARQVFRAFRHVRKASWCTYSSTLLVVALRMEVALCTCSTKRLYS